SASAVVGSKIWWRNIVVYGDDGGLGRNQEHAVEEVVIDPELEDVHIRRPELRAGHNIVGICDCPDEPVLIIARVREDRRVNMEIEFVYRLQLPPDAGRDGIAMHIQPRVESDAKRVRGHRRKASRDHPGRRPSARPPWLSPAP